MSQVLYFLLKKSYSNLIIDVITVQWSSEVLKFMPEINKSILYNKNKNFFLNIINQYHLGTSLKYYNYDQAFILPNSFKSCLVPFLAKIPVRTGWRGEMRYGLINDMRILKKDDFPLMVQRYAALAFDKEVVRNYLDLPKLLYTPTFFVKENEVQQIKKKYNLHVFNKKLIVGICPGAANNKKKCWPYYHYSNFIKKLLNKKKYLVILLGSANDLYILNSIENLLSDKEKKYCINFKGGTSLYETILLLSSCHGVVTNDSGLMHVSGALNIPLIALYGPTDPYFTPPLSKNSKILYLNYKNQDCDKDGYCKSLIDIRPNTVLFEFEKLLMKLNII